MSAKPFLLIQFRPEDAASDNEYEAFLKFGGLQVDELKRLRAESNSAAGINPDDYAAIIFGGGPGCVSDPQAKKSAEQQRYEAELSMLLEKIIADDSPFLGACYGLGILAHVLGAKFQKSDMPRPSDP